MSGLPTHSFTHNSAVYEKKMQRSHGRPLTMAIPGVRNARLQLPDSARLQRYCASRLTRRPLLVCFAFTAVIMTVLLVSKSFGSPERSPENEPESSTLVFSLEQLQSIWSWEIQSGHFPTRRRVPAEIGLPLPPDNPGIPPLRNTPFHQGALLDPDLETIGTGARRVYLHLESLPPNVAHPPRPLPGSIADMDDIESHCSFSDGKYVRDCLEVLRIAGGLDNGKRVRRGKLDDWKYVYRERSDESLEPVEPHPIPTPGVSTGNSKVPLVKKIDAEWEPQLLLPPIVRPNPIRPSTPCDDQNPRIFHIFWTGPFTDKPYLALLSFLFTQNTGIHHKSSDETQPIICRPEIWLWINPGPAAAVPNPNAKRDMFAQLKMNPWAAPFLHPRFNDVIKFKLWNTTEMLDGISELKDEWRTLKYGLFNSGGHIIEVPAAQKVSSDNATSTSSAAEDDLLNRTGSKSSDSYDRLSVILSDMARFVLCHRYGGIYLDADTIFLRDWEELLGYKGAFAYRWSRLPKYNTAILRLNKGSALGTFLFRTALRNGLDFHPMSISRYVADAHLERLLLRLPDALFDPAWLNTEEFQRDRPPQPYFTEFNDFFETPTQKSAAPQALGFDGFFKGAYSYHFHNFWWKPFDPARNFPDLGPKFIAGERKARTALKAERNITASLSDIEEDRRDLDWSTVIKRIFESYIRGERPNMYGEWINW
ncbi:glycosyltransferase family 32 protein [Mycena floridula]|nr:glycosyltransferase family 32 protein [Mycena floridula]